MQDRQTRRQMLGLAALAVGIPVAGHASPTTEMPSLTPKKKIAARPAREDIARVMRSYAGEFGGGMGGR